MNTSLVIIDAQNDFCCTNGTLSVPGAHGDCTRLASFIASNEARIDSIHMTLDSHDYYNIAHPVFWKDAHGGEPPVFTVITSGALKKGEYAPVDGSLNDYAARYVDELEKNGKYQLILWPPHCLIGTWGCCVQSDVHEAVLHWQKAKRAPVNYIIKGKNPLTEHYSAIEAEVPVGDDDSTHTNTAFLNTLKNDSRVIVAGEALSHCVAWTIRDIARHIGAQKITLLSDCSSSVAGFEAQGKAFVEALCAQGMNYRTSNFLQPPS